MIVLDTNVLSELMKTVPGAAVFAWLDRQRRAALFTTAVSLAEVYYRLEILPQGRRRASLTDAARAIFEENFAGRVLSLDADAAMIYSTLERPAGEPAVPSVVSTARLPRSHAPEAPRWPHATPPISSSAASAS
jgi:toxin FitB